jgi:hypothetical protein
LQRFHNLLKNDNIVIKHWNITKRKENIY